MKNAILKAIEGGFIAKPKHRVSYPLKPDGYTDGIFLDPLFWQCLGKGLGWKNGMFGLHQEFGAEKPWKYQWHTFIDALSEGKSPDDFFKDLLNGTNL